MIKDVTVLITKVTDKHQKSNIPGSYCIRIIEISISINKDQIMMVKDVTVLITKVINIHQKSNIPGSYCKRII